MPGVAEEFDTEQLEPYMVRENVLLMLAFQGGDLYVPVRTTSHVETPYLYDAIAEGQLTAPVAASPSFDGITNHTVQTPLQVSSSKLPGKPTDVFDLARFPHILYQMWVGVDPPQLRVLVQQPYRIDQRVLPIIGHTSSYFQAGYISGEASPLGAPDPKSMLWVAPGISPAFGYVVTDPEPAYPLLRFWINAITLMTVIDPALVRRMIDEAGLAQYVTVGGIQKYPYDPQQYYGIRGVHLWDSDSELAAGLAFQPGRVIDNTRGFV